MHIKALKLDYKVGKCFFCGFLKKEGKEEGIREKKGKGKDLAPFLMLPNCISMMEEKTLDTTSEVLLAFFAIEIRSS